MRPSFSPPNFEEYQLSTIECERKTREATNATLNRIAAGIKGYPDNDLAIEKFQQLYLLTSPLYQCETIFSDDDEPETSPHDTKPLEKLTNYISTILRDLNVINDENLLRRFCDDVVCIGGYYADRVLPIAVAKACGALF